MSLSDAAYAGTLTLSQLRIALEKQPEQLDDISGTINLTPLCAACLGGHLRVVKHLLSCGANPNTPSGQNHTPLFYVISPQCNISSGTRCAIIRELVSGKHGEKANLDLPCDDSMNTALMLSISELKDNEVVAQLLKCGASKTVTFRPQQTSAEQLMRRGNGHADTGTIPERLLERAVSFVLMILVFFNFNTQDMIIRRMYDRRMCLSDDRNPELSNNTVVEEGSTLVDLFPVPDESVEQEKKLEFVVADPPPTRTKPRFLDEVRTRAKRLQEDPTTDLGQPGNIERLLKLSKRRLVILCDDSKSMTLEHRHAYQTELVRRLAGVGTRLLPTAHARVDLRFVNHDFRHSVPVSHVQKVMHAVRPSSGSSLGTSLRQKVLQPLVYDATAAADTEKETLLALRRPLLICIVTDGAPTTERAGALQAEILECKEYLESRGYHRNSVLYNIIQIGNDSAATEFVSTFHDSQEIKDVVRCSEGRIDAQFEAVWDDDRKLDTWILDILMAPLGLPSAD